MVLNVATKLFRIFAKRDHSSASDIVSLFIIIDKGKEKNEYAYIMRIPRILIKLDHGL